MGFLGPVAVSMWPTGHYIMSNRVTFASQGQLAVSPWPTCDIYFSYFIMYFLKKNILWPIIVMLY